MLKISSLCVFAFILITLGGERLLFADTYADTTRKCALCEQEFHIRLAMSETRQGMRLDLRPVGFLTAPHPIGTCTKCGFVDFMNGDEYSKDELAVLRKFVASDEYQKLAAEETPYFRAAKLLEQLKHPDSQIATVYLKATWEVEQDKERLPKYLAACLASYENVIADKKQKPEDLLTPRMLKGELLRRLGKFDDAKKHFESLQSLDEFKAEVPKFLVEVQLGLIENKDNRPHMIPSRPEKDKQ